MRNSNWLFIYRQAPEEGGVSQDALDFMLVAAAFGIALRVLFVGEGVKHIVLPKGKPASSELPRYVKTFGALEDFEITNVEVLDSSLENDLTKNLKFRVPTTRIDAKTMRQRIAGAQKVFTF